VQLELHGGQHLARVPLLLVLQLGEGWLVPATYNMSVGWKNLTFEVRASGSEFWISGLGFGCRAWD